MLGWIRIEIEKHFKLRSTIPEIDVGLFEVHLAVVHADVLPALGADPFLERIVTHCKKAFEEEFIAPWSFVAFDERTQAAARHLRGRFETCVIQEGSRVIEAGDEVVELTSALFQVCKEFADDVIEAGDGLVIADVMFAEDVGLIVVRVGLVSAALVLIEDELRNETVGISARVGRKWDGDVSVELVVERISFEFWVFVGWSSHPMPLWVAGVHRGHLGSVRHVEAH